MAFSARTISREMEVQMGKAPPCFNPIPMVNPLSQPRYVSPWLSKSAPVFQFGISNGHGALDLCVERKRGREVVHVKYLFGKILTRSDVGKLNRVLIPKLCAEECFPKISESNNRGDDVFLKFEDLSTGLIWCFRFCLWNNRRSYVLTKGWNAFIKEKYLKEGDILSFYRDTSKSASTNHMLLHIKPHNGTMSLPYPVPSQILSPPSLMIDDRDHENPGLGTSHGIVPSMKPLSFGSGEMMPPTNLMPQETTVPDSAPVELVRAEKRLRLFGVDIDIPSHDDCGDEPCGGFTKNVASIAKNILEE